MRAILLVLTALALPGCCFGAFSEGFALQTDCDAVIASVNASTARVDALPDPLAGLAAPTPEQVAVSMDPMAQSYDQAATELATIPVTNTQVLAQRDALVALYRESAGMLRTQAGVMAQAMRVGDGAAIDAAGSSMDSLGAREDAIINTLNGICGR